VVEDSVYVGQNHRGKGYDRHDEQSGTSE
jgi:L-amino acid N-acyltransferase YncA